MKTLIPLSILLALGCSPLRYQRIDLPEPQKTEEQEAPAEDIAQNVDDPPPKTKRRVILVMMPGLRSDVFAQYLKQLKEDDYTPSWHSGIAFLGAHGFRLAQAKQAEAPVPALTMASMASILTGQYPSTHQFPASQFYTQAEGQAMFAYDFERPLDASRLIYEPGLRITENPQNILGQDLIVTPTLYERLQKTGRSVSLLVPFARGAVNYLPDKPLTSTAAALPLGSGASRVPEVDRAARLAAIHALTAKDLEDLFVMDFLGAQSGGCFQKEAVCTGQVGQLNELQLQALQKIDGELWRIFKTYESNHPNSFKNTTVLLVSPAGLSGRTKGQSVDRQHKIPTDELMAMLNRYLPEECNLNEPLQQGFLGIAMQEGFAQLYVREMPYGQKHLQNKWQICLAHAAEQLAAQEPAISGAAWRIASQNFDVSYQATLDPQFQKSLKPSQKQRLLEKMKLIASPSMIGTTPQAGADALLFVASPWYFVDDAQRPLPYAMQGNLDLETTTVPFLVASRALSQKTEVALRTLPIEMTDITPTILSLLDAPKDAFEGLPRAPILKWHDNENLEINEASRQMARKKSSLNTRFLLREEDDQLWVGFEESTEEWPPDAIEFRVGDQRYHYDGQAETFDSEDCKTEIVEKRHAWYCKAPLDRSRPAETWAVVHRIPDGEYGPGLYAQKIILGQSEPEFLNPPSLVCATDEFAKVRIDAKDALGFDRIDLFLTDEISPTLNQISPGGLTFSTSLSQQQPNESCLNMEESCFFEAKGQTLQGEYQIPLNAQLFYHMHRIQKVNDGIQSRSNQLRQATIDAGLQGNAPKDAIVGLRLCSVSGACKWIALASDTDYEEKVKGGCQ